jgi:hypothetical protein
MDVQQQRQAAVASARGAVVANWCIRSSNAITLAGLLVLASGIGIYAAAKTWMSWDKESVLPGIGQVSGNVEDHLHITGLVPLLFGAAGLVGVGFGIYLSRNKKPSELRRVGLAFAAMASMLAMAYGGSLLACPIDMRLLVNWDRWAYEWHYFLDRETCTVVANVGLSVLSLGGLITAGGLAGKVAGNVGRKATGG